MTVTSPTSGAAVGGTITVSARVSPVGALVGGVQFRLDSANLGTEDTSAPYSVSWNTRGTGNGSHTLRAVAQDALGLRFSSNPVTVTVFNDTTPPAVAITSPSPGATVSGSITLTATASDNVGVLGVQFKLDGADLGPEDDAAPYSVEWDTTASSDAPHTLTAVARDAAGNARTSSEVVVTVSNGPPPDVTPPEVTIASPSPGVTVSDSITVSATASDDVGVAAVQFKVDGVDLGPEDATAPYSVDWDTATAADGSHTLTAMARDAAGNPAASDPVTVTVSNGPLPDTTPPAVTITSPSSGATVSGSITVSAAASDDVGVAAVQFKVDGVDLGPEDASAPYSVDWDTTTAADGSHTLTAMARDAAGNPAASDPVTVTVSNGPLPDTTPPAVTITSPSSGATVSGSITVSAAASDDVGVAAVQFKVDGVDLGPEDASAPYSVDWDTTTAADGSHTLTAMARDAAGNPAASDPVTVTVSNGPLPDTTPPAVTITSPSSGATVSGSITVSATASDDVGVAAVQFKVDGVDLGPEDASAPYSVDWDTTAAADGSHTLTAMARDAAGNPAASDPVTVTVSNAPPPDPAVTRFEEADPSVTYAGAWIQGNTARAWSGGTAAISTAAGAQATLTFTGASVNWIGARGTHGGIARVLVDGALVAEVDTYSTSEEIQAVVFSKTDLAEATHTLTVEVTGLKNPASMDVAIIVDAFDVTSSSPSPKTERPPEPQTSPGAAAGDANWDCSLDLSDAVFTLEYLFLGGAEPSCLSTVDLNRDRKIDISDPILILNFLFAGGPESFPGPLPHAAGGYPGCTKIGCLVRSRLAVQRKVDVWINLLEGATPEDLIAALEREFRVGGDGVAGSDCPTQAELCDISILDSSSPLPATVRNPAVLDALETMSGVAGVERIREDEEP